MNSATRALVALVVGLAMGAALRAWGSPSLVEAAKGLAPIGVLWLNALKMTLVPLVFALVVSGVGSWMGVGQGGRLVGGSLVVFAVMLTLAALVGAGVWAAWGGLAPPVDAASVLSAAGASRPPPVPSLTEQIMSLVPANPVGAAAEGAITPLVVFALIFGLASTRVPDAPRRAVQLAIDGLGQTMMVIVGWVLLAAPLGVFILAMGMTLSVGLQGAAPLVQLTLLNCAAPLAGIALAYAVARIGGGVGLLRFGRAALGAQAVAAGTTSSMGSLPAMVEGAEQGLQMPPAIAGAVLPLAVSTFRVGNVTCVVASALFAAHAAGLHPNLAQIAVMSVVAMVTSVGIAGVPGAAVLYAAFAPAFVAIGAPVAWIPLMIAVWAIPDVFTTTCNVTNDLAAASVVARWMRGSAPSRTADDLAAA